MENGRFGVWDSGFPNPGGDWNPGWGVDGKPISLQNIIYRLGKYRKYMGSFMGNVLLLQFWGVMGY